jgi:HEAT repeat protein
MNFESLQAQLLTKHPDRMKVMSQSRALPLTDRFNLMCLAVKDENPRIRYDAVSQLGTLGTVDPSLTEQILTTALKEDPEIDVKAAAADSLGALQIQTAFPLLVETYHNNPDWLLRLSIVAALGILGVKDAFEVLAEALQSDNDLIKISAIRALGDLADDRAIPLLTPLKNHPDWQIRHALAQTLGNFGNQVESILQELSQDPTPQVIESAHNSLNNIATKVS